MGFITRVFDNISTGLGCIVADINCEAAKEEARRQGVDVDSLEKELYGEIGNALAQAEVDGLVDRQTVLDMEIKEKGTDVEPEVLEEALAIKEKLQELCV